MRVSAALRSMTRDATGFSLYSQLLRSLLLVWAFGPAMGQPPLTVTHSAAPLDVVIRQPPSQVRAHGQLRLLYELRLTNFNTAALDVQKVEIADQDGKVLAVLTGSELIVHLRTLGEADGAVPQPRLAPGGSAVLFTDLTLPLDAQTPRQLIHRISVGIENPGHEPLLRTIAISAITPLGEGRRISAPLRGMRWVAVNGLMNPDHRRSYNAFDGHEYLAQRFAIDWIQLGSDGHYVHGDPKDNRNYVDYGAPVLAVAPARVVSVHDGLAENAGSTPIEGRTLTLDNASGNSVVLDLGAGVYALYAHLQPGSLQVKPGQHVATGTLLGRLGNSGNSDGPHLHFQLMDGPEPLGAEGLPFVIDHFRERGQLKDANDLDRGGFWRPLPGVAAVTRSDEFPVDNAVVDFPNAPEP